MSGIRNVIMDLGGVMLEWNPDHVLTPFEPQPEPRRRLRTMIFGPDWRKFDRGQLSELELTDRMEQTCGLPRSRVLEIIAAVRDSLHEKTETVQIVRGLHQRGFDIYCLSNMPSPIFAHLRRRHTFWDLFRGIVISGEIQLMKPEPEIYVHLLERFGLNARESVFIDDLQPNIEAARAAGLHAIRFQDAQQCQRELDLLLP